MKFNLIPKVMLLQLFDKIGGKIFRVTFKKNNGQYRDLIGRLGVKVHLKGTGRSISKDLKNSYICVYDVQNKGYRNVNLNSVTQVKCDKNYEVY